MGHGPVYPTVLELCWAFVGTFVICESPTLLWGSTMNSTPAKLYRNLHEGTKGGLLWSMGWLKLEYCYGGYCQYCMVLQSPPCNDKRLWNNNGVKEKTNSAKLPLKKEKSMCETGEQNPPLSSLLIYLNFNFCGCIEYFDLTICTENCLLNALKSSLKKWPWYIANPPSLLSCFA